MLGISLEKSLFTKSSKISKLCIFFIYEAATASMKCRDFQIYLFQKTLHYELHSSNMSRKQYNNILALIYNKDLKTNILSYTNKRAVQDILKYTDLIL